MQHFASDNYAGICPEGLDVLIAANNSGLEVRFMPAPWLGLLDGDVWLRNARHANAMAQLLQRRLQEIPGVSIMFPSESNAVFAQLPAQAAKAMRARLEVLRIHWRGRLPVDVRMGHATGYRRAFCCRSARTVHGLKARAGYGAARKT